MSSSLGSSSIFLPSAAFFIWRRIFPYFFSFLVFTFFYLVALLTSLLITPPPLFLRISECPLYFLNGIPYLPSFLLIFFPFLPSFLPCFLYYMSIPSSLLFIFFPPGFFSSSSVVTCIVSLRIHLHLSSSLSLILFPCVLYIALHLLTLLFLLLSRSAYFSSFSSSSQRYVNHSYSFYILAIFLLHL